MPELPWVGARAAERDELVVARRGPRRRHDPWRYQGMVVEDERTADDAIARVATVFLTGRECPWRCVMCDLWRHTTEDDTPHGAIPAQIAAAREALARTCPGVTQLKLYNAGSFFDPRAVPEADYPAIAAHLSGLDRVIVESHPALVGARLDRFLDALDRTTRAPHLEVAMGLETAHPEALERLNKRMTLAQFSAAAGSLLARRVDLRVFLLVCPPFVPGHEQDEWLLHSIDIALNCGASVVSLVPVRPGNGILDALAVEGLFRPPHLGDVERSVASAHRHHGGRGRLFIDLWDLARFSACELCFEDRKARLHTMNLKQRVLPPVACDGCMANRLS